MVAKKDIDKANNVDLYSYLITYHRDDVTVSGDWLKLNTDISVNVRQGYHKWKDFSGKRSKDGREWLSPIDFMMIFYGMTFSEAVEALCNGEDNLLVVNSDDFRKEFYLPSKDNDSNKQAIAYLTKTRKLPTKLIDSLLKNNMIYQTAIVNPNTQKSYKNIVFVNTTKDYYETHGTISFGKSFHGCGKKQIDCYWGVATSSNVKTVYICEASIDALSLLTLHSNAKISANSFYASIGGADNFKTIERIIRDFPNAQIILAVDNDDNTSANGNAGQTCRDRFPNLGAIIPTNKDWNEDLIATLM